MARNYRTRTLMLTQDVHDPYLEAEALFVAGRIPVAQAVGMMLSDCAYIAECELSGRNATLYAETIVRDIWARRLLEGSNG